MAVFRRVIAFKRDAVLVATTGEQVFFLEMRIGGDPRPRIRIADFRHLEVGDLAVMEKLIVFPGGCWAAVTDGRYLYRFDATGRTRDSIDVAGPASMPHKGMGPQVMWPFGATMERNALLFWLTQCPAGSLEQRRLACYEFETQRLLVSESRRDVWAPCCASRREQIVYLWSPQRNSGTGKLVALQTSGAVVREYKLPMEFDGGALSLDERKLVLWATVAGVDARPVVLDLKTGSQTVLGQRAASAAWAADGVLLLFQRPGRILTCDLGHSASSQLVVDFASNPWWQHDFEWSRIPTVSEDRTLVAVSIRAKRSPSASPSKRVMVLIDLQRAEYRLTRDFYSVGWMSPVVVSRSSEFERGHSPAT